VSELAPDVMSALGQKRTLFTAQFYDCFAPESGHVSAWAVVEEWGVGAYSLAKGRGGSRPLTATLLRRGPRPLRALDC
jgi:hypothetical protein